MATKKTWRGFLVNASGKKISKCSGCNFFIRVKYLPMKYFEFTFSICPAEVCYIKLTRGTLLRFV